MLLETPLLDIICTPCGFQSGAFLQVETLENRVDSLQCKPRGSKDSNHKTCQECGKVFWHRRAMIYHKKIVHSGKKYFFYSKLN